MPAGSESALISALSIAPMIDWTNTHFRVFLRLLAPQALLYTEMQTPGAIFNQPERALQFDPVEHPLALQIGGSDEEALVKCAVLAEKQGFNEINLNLGCPSDRVQAGRFGACLMAEPKRVAGCIRAMKRAVQCPITAKTRIGIDTRDDYPFFSSFVHSLIEAGCDKLIVHARKAWLHGLNPKQNRCIPPLHYEYVYRIKQECPTVPIVINGNIEGIEAIRMHLDHVDGVMLGRLACHHPYAVAGIHHALFPMVPLRSRACLLATYLSYVEEQYVQKSSISRLLKPLFNLAHALPGARLWKAQLMQIQKTRDLKTMMQLTRLMSTMEQV